MSRGTDDNVTTIDHTPQWAKGGENLLQQPWFVPSAVEVRWLYTHNTRKSSQSPKRNIF